MIKILKTNSENKDFQNLILKLDADLAERNGNNNDFFTQFNKTDQINHVIVAYFDNQPAGCGAIKVYDSNTMEVKRMFVPEEFRGRNIAMSILKNLALNKREAFISCIILNIKTILLNFV